MNELVAFCAAPRATRDAWCERPRLRDFATMVLEWLAVAVGAAALVHALSGLPLRTVVAAFMPFLVATLLLVVMRRTGFPWAMRGTTGRHGGDREGEGGPADAKRTSAASPADIRAARARVALAVGTFALLTPILPLMVGSVLLQRQSRSGQLPVGVVVVIGWLFLLLLLWLVAVKIHGSVIERAGTLSTVAFWRGIGIELLLNLVLIVTLLLTLGAALIGFFRVPSLSMWPTLTGSMTVGDIMLVDQTAWWFDDPARFDIAVVDHPGYETRMVKRIIALGGERVALDGGNIWIHDEIVVRPPAVQYSQMQRPPVASFHPPSDRTAFEVKLASEDLGDAERTARLANWPTEYEKQTRQWLEHEQLALVAQTQTQTATQTRPQTATNDEAGATDGPPRSPAWVPVPFDDLPSGIHLARDGIPSRVRLAVEPTDPAIRHLRSTHICDDLALQLRLTGGSGLTITFVAHSGSDSVTHVFALTRDAVGTRLVGGVQRSDGTAIIDQQLYEPSDTAANAGVLSLRVQTIDGLWDAWIDGRRVPGHERRQPFALRSTITSVDMFIEATSPTTIHGLVLTTPTHYIPFGLLGTPAGVTVPEGRYLLLGDHPIQTMDSRNWEALQVVWPDGREDWRALDGDPPSLMVSVPAPDMDPASLDATIIPASVANDFFYDAKRRTIDWIGFMRPEERDQLRTSNSHPAWQAAIDELYRRSQTVPRTTRLAPYPFLARDQLVGRVEAVVAGPQRERIIR